MSGTETGCATDAASPITGAIITIGARADPSPSAARHNRVICKAFLVRMLRNGAKVAQKCVMTAQKCVITRHVAHRPERPHRPLCQ
jgi:hypothetical protein